MTTQLKTNTNTDADVNTKALQDYFDSLLEWEWLWDIDREEGFKDIINDTVGRSLKLLDVSDLVSELEEIHQVKFEIDKEFNEIILKNPIGQTIWYFRSRYYSHWKVEIFKHVERHIEPEYRWKGLAKAIDKVWRMNNFANFQTEVSHKPSNLLFLQSIWYQIVWYYDDNAEVQELTSWEIFQLEKQLKSLALNWDRDLDFSYYLSKTWRIESENNDYEY